ncbi:hypothetical protein LMH87_005246 [Akanthomyces muscarius]|uniref:Uncharacterized protein n=1 Tax=Akanthomyces muscarius TaxID=2231603 RepID=A0A9W8URP4_AKAMU|nr:hypothetical protein LMH87_005246 [Akanthomyces muscarius]KAJ4163525.1 hypothetical protein LMH87_005246 [Akanthomyces muscarius]
MKETAPDQLTYRANRQRTYFQSRRFTPRRTSGNHDNLLLGVFVRTTPTPTMPAIPILRSLSSILLPFPLALIKIF